ncbi:Neuropeptide Y receptor type 2 [Frankliniella fusca]|uniref:Neuropeptide Y receptor type 2 n=1 Tax=Frankliniella fusca TaxID=407009 RepID=A0AAE1LQ26_9NEOP|nr:Neuropeptide Y receptor type 2 [Frankliniella fusca]
MYFQVYETLCQDYDNRICVAERTVHPEPLLGSGMEATVSPGGAPIVGPVGPGQRWDTVLLLNGSALSPNGTLSNDTFLDEPLYAVPFHIVLLLTFFYVSISVAAIVGNGLVLWVVATSRRMQSVTNCFIANLALADVIIGLFAIPFQVRKGMVTYCVRILYPVDKGRRNKSKYRAEDSLSRETFALPITDINAS